MSRQHFAFTGASLISCGLSLFSTNVHAQEPKGALPAAVAGDHVIIKRAAMHIEPPQKYKVSLAVEPIRSVTLTAPFDGIVRQAEAKPNSKVQQQTDVVRLDNTTAKLRLARAEAALRIVTAEQKLASDKDELHKTLAQAKVDEAKADADLAKYILEQASVRAPFAGEVQRMLVSDGQYVRTGDPLAVIVDNSKLRAEVPVERASAVQGKTLPLKIETVEVDAKVDSVLPLDARFSAMRDVFDSVASAVLIVDNADGRFKAGQSVYVPLIPRQPVAEVPASAIGNLPDGQRKIQVVRHTVIRDIPVIVMGSVGPNRLFVSGAFADGDEVIYEWSHQLSDGFVLKSAAPNVTVGAAGVGAAPSNTAPPAATTPPAKPAVGF